MHSLSRFSSSFFYSVLSGEFLFRVCEYVLARKCDIREERSEMESVRYFFGVTFIGKKYRNELFHFIHCNK